MRGNLIVEEAVEGRQQGGRQRLQEEHHLEGQEGGGGQGINREGRTVTERERGQVNSRLENSIMTA